VTDADRAHDFISKRVLKSIDTNKGKILLKCLSIALLFEIIILLFKSKIFLFGIVGICNKESTIGLNGKSLGDNLLHDFLLLGLINEDNLAIAIEHLVDIGKDNFGGTLAECTNKARVGWVTDASGCSLSRRVKGNQMKDVITLVLKNFLAWNLKIQ
jgi:hypothetical protein